MSLRAFPSFCQLQPRACAASLNVCFLFKISVRIITFLGLDSASFLIIVRSHHTPPFPSFLVIAHFISDQYSGRGDPISFHLTFIFDGSNFIRTNFLVKFCWYHQFSRHLTWNHRVILYFFTISKRDSYELWMIVWCFWIMDVNISTHSNFQFRIWIICRMHAFNDL